MSANMQNSIFTNEAKAREWLEARIWPNGPTCPHCGNADQTRITAMHGTVHRAGLYQCNEPECREQFTVTVGTVFERSKIPLTKWLAALFLLSCSKKGMSTHQMHRMLDISYKSTWFMTHRLREAMRAGDLPPMGGPVALSKWTKLSSVALKAFQSREAARPIRTSCLPLLSAADRLAVSILPARAVPMLKALCARTSARSCA